MRGRHGRASESGARAGAEQDEQRLAVDDKPVDVPVAERRVRTGTGVRRLWQQGQQFARRSQYDHAGFACGLTASSSVLAKSAARCRPLLDRGRPKHRHRLSSRPCHNVLAGLPLLALKVLCDSLQVVVQGRSMCLALSANLLNDLVRLGRHWSAPLACRSRVARSQLLCIPAQWHCASWRSRCACSSRLAESLGRGQPRPLWHHAPADEPCSELTNSVVGCF